jgi:hypothetical protein
MIDWSDSSTCTANSGEWTIQYRRFKHWFPARNLDFVISIGELLKLCLEERIRLVALPHHADQPISASDFVSARFVSGVSLRVVVSDGMS